MATIICRQLEGKLMDTGLTCGSAN